MNDAKTDEAFDAVREALPEFSQQDDYLLAHGASLMSEDSHEIVHVDTVRKIVAAALQWAASQQAAEVEADEAELRLFEETVEQFADCGETDTPYETLMKFANRGWLECQHFVTTAEGRRVLATLEPPLFASPPSTQGGGHADQA